GVGVGQLPLPDSAPGGEYILTVREENNRFPPQERKFLVNRYQKPRLDKKLDYNRSSFGPGGEVQALCSATRADGGAVAGREVRVSVTVDERTYGRDGKPSAQRFAFRTDDQGKVTVSFKLPAHIEKGQASVAVTFDDGANTETLVRTIPVVLKKLDVE